MSEPKTNQRKSALAAALADVRQAFLAIGLFGFCINLLMLTGPLYMLQVYDRVLTSGSRHTLLMLTIVAVGMLASAALLELLRSFVLVRIGARLDRKLAARLFGELLRGQLQRQGTADTQPLRDLDTLRSFLTGPGLIAFFDAPWSPLYLVIVFLLHPLLGIVALGGTIVLAALAVVSEVATRDALQAAASDNRAALGFTENVLRNAEVVRAMGMLPGLQRRWLARHEAAMAAQARASDRGSVILASAKLARQVLQIAMLGTGAFLALQQAITPGVMIAASIIMGRALAPVEGAIGHWRGLVMARGAKARLGKLLGGEEAPAECMPLPRPSGALAVERLVAAAPGLTKPVLKGISFAIAAGESLGVIGPSAAGKSTLARLLVGVWAPTAGHVRLDGADVAEWDAVALGPALGYLPQDVELFDGTVAENIARFGEVNPDAVVRAARVAGVHEMILRLPEGYDSNIGAGGQALSAGQRQRIGLARALYDDPVLVVLDEPNSNLDGEGEHALRRALEELKRRGATVVMIAHRPSVLAGTDKLLVLRDGLMEHFGATEDVLPMVTKAVPRTTAEIATISASPLSEAARA